jgi:hypothetical protein
METLKTGNYTDEFLLTQPLYPDQMVFFTGTLGETAQIDRASGRVRVSDGSGDCADAGGNALRRAVYSGNAQGARACRFKRWGAGEALYRQLGKRKVQKIAGGRKGVKELKLLAFDLGASNGRAMLARFDGERIRLSELHRFDNAFVGGQTEHRWDAMFLTDQLRQGFSACRLETGAGPDCFGIDTWGVDFGLLDAEGVSSKTRAVTATRRTRRCSPPGSGYLSVRCSNAPALRR